VQMCVHGTVYVPHRRALALVSRTARGRGAWSVVTRRRRFTYSLQHIY
jgi:aspartate oxidase